LFVEIGEGFSDVNPKFFLGGAGADTEAIYNLC
jgi:hypothetical protein